MAGQNDIALQISVEAATALKNLTAFQQQATQSLETIKKSVSSMEKSAASGLAVFEKGISGLKAFGAAVVGAFAVSAVKDFFAESIAAAAEQEAGLRRLSTAMQLTGEFTQGALDDFSAFADQMEATTKFGDDLVISQLAIAKSFGVSNAGAKDLVKAAADLASATGVDLETAVRQLGATYSGTAGKLEKTVPILKSLTEEQLRNGEAIKLITDRFGGSAQEEVKTFSGAVIQTKNAFEDMQKAIGKTIIENPTVIAAVQAVTKVFRELEGTVSGNEDGIGLFISETVKVVAASVPVITASVGAITQVVGFLAQGFGEAFADVIDVAAAFGETIYNTLGSLVIILGKFAATIAEIFGGVNNSVSTAIDGFLADFERAAEETDAATRNTAASIRTSTTSMTKQFDEFGKGLDRVKGVVNAAAKAVAESDISNKKAAASAGAFGANMGHAGAAAAASAADVKKLADELKHLQDTLVQNSTDEVGRISIEYRKQLDEIDKLYKKHQISAQQAADFRVQAETILTTKIGKIRDDDAAKQDKEAQDAAAKSAQAYASYLSTVAQLGATETEKLQFQKDQQLAAIEKFEADATISHEEAMKARAAVDENYINQRAKLFADNPIKAFIDSGGDISGSDAVGAGVGLATSALQGKEGAKSLVTSGIGALGDAAGIPGLGQVAGLLAGGPEQTKAMVKAFVQAIPDIIQAIAESIPVVVEVFVDTMVNKGGAVKIAVAIAKAMAGGSILAAAGKQLGLSTSAHFDGPKLGRIMGSVFNAETIPKLLTSIPNAIQAGGDRLRLYFAEIPDKIIAGFINGAEYAVKGLVHAFDVADQIQAIADAVWLPIKETFEGFGRGFQLFKNGISDLLSFKFPSIPVPPWLDTFIDGINAASGGGGGGNGVASDTYHAIIGHARGISEIPPGFPNDSYLMRAESGEGVVDAGTNKKLIKYLNDQENGGGNSVTNALLAQLIGLMKGGAQQPVQINIGGKKIADIILDLNRAGARLA